ncbi:carboxymuconolactone decarboxylase family protein [Saccharothrix obliqua]|uniref:carboxymuconolactone decarboxylase family protein n=1 Tax=Saccharothrix obliqua TaxID=2861747 RepID=UPI001C6032BB|nr:carboxymuconolactone decarboxylase family protein [Saccharothrix obliqua]MBW4721756.1 carboxymuconolactone decarboxylase family protein [Saccharothrix obliqua]
MPRIPVLTTEQANPLVKLAYRFAKRRFGAVPEPVAMTAHHRGLMMANARHEMGVERAARTLPASLRDLVVYATAVKLGCTWCVDFTAMLIKHEGLDVERLREIHVYQSSDKYTDIEKLALAYAEAMTDTPVTVTDEQVAELDRRLGHRGLVELTYLIAVENQRARFNSAFGITDQGFTSGDACRVPMP